MLTHEQAAGIRAAYLAGQAVAETSALMALPLGVVAGEVWRQQLPARVYAPRLRPDEIMAARERFGLSTAADAAE